MSWESWNKQTPPNHKLSLDSDTAVTIIPRVVPDHAALFGMLCRIRDLRLALISVEYLTNFTPAQTGLQ